MTHPVSAGVTAWATVRATFVVVAAASRSWSATRDRKSTRLNSSHSQISYAVFCLKKKKEDNVDTCHMYVNVDKTASDVLAEFVSVTEQLMEELEHCYKVVHLLDINNTIDHLTAGY